MDFGRAFLKSNFVQSMIRLFVFAWKHSEHWQLSRNQTNGYLCFSLAQALLLFGLISTTMKRPSAVAFAIDADELAFFSAIFKCRWTEFSTSFLAVSKPNILPRVFFFFDLHFSQNCFRFLLTNWHSFSVNPLANAMLNRLNWSAYRQLIYKLDSDSSWVYPICKWIDNKFTSFTLELSAKAIAIVFCDTEQLHAIKKDSPAQCNAMRLNDFDLNMKIACHWSNNEMHV